MKKVNFNNLNRNNYIKKPKNASQTQSAKIKKTNVKKIDTNNEIYIPTHSNSYAFEMISKCIDEYNEEQKRQYSLSSHNDCYGQKHKNHTYKALKQELDATINDYYDFTVDYVEKKKKERGILAKFRKIEEYELNEWLDEIEELPKVKKLIKKMDDIILMINNEFYEDLTDYAENKLNQMFKHNQLLKTSKITIVMHCFK